MSTVPTITNTASAQIRWMLRKKWTPEREAVIWAEVWRDRWESLLEMPEDRRQLVLEARNLDRPTGGHSQTLAKPVNDKSGTHDEDGWQKHNG